MFRNRWIFAAALTGTLLAMGCGGKKNTRVDETEEAFVDAQGVQFDDFKMAADELIKKISARNAKGWPAYVRVGEYGQPAVRLGTMTNNTRARVDTNALRNEIYNVLVNNADAVVVQADKGDLADIQEERDYADDENNRTQSDIEDGAEDATNLIIKGDINQERIVNEDGVEQYTTIFFIRVFDTRKAQIVPGLLVKRKIRKQRG